MTDPKKIVEEYMDAVFRHDSEKVRHLLHNEYTYTSGDGQSQKGIEAGVAIAEMYGNAFPDMKFEIQNMFLSGNIVVTEFIVKATHSGNLMDIAPTNRKVVVNICDVTEIREGKIYAEREYFDMAHLLQQLGVEIGHEHHA
jgi:steroid delta-isomerase-like uncharacterized protein